MHLFSIFIIQEFISTFRNLQAYSLQPYRAHDILLIIVYLTLRPNIPPRKQWKSLLLVEEGNNLFHQNRGILTLGIHQMEHVLLPMVLNNLHRPFPLTFLQLLIVIPSNGPQMIFLRHEHQHPLTP